MPLNAELAPTYAIIKVFEVIFSNEQINHVIAEISYPRISITHKMQISRDDLVSFLKSGEQVSYRGNPWILDEEELIIPIEIKQDRINKQFIK